jgi:hypothetical protein
MTKQSGLLGRFRQQLIHKEIPMFKLFSTMTFFGLLMIPAAYAQSGQPIQAKVPFAFTVQNTTMAAGNYQMTYSQSAHILTIRRLEQNSGGVFATAIPAGASESSSGPGRLVFQCYGNACYLAHVWQAATARGRGLDVPEGKQERKMTFLARAVSITIAAKPK